MKRIDSAKLALIAAANDANDPGPSKYMLDIFLKGVRDGHRLEVLIYDMAAKAEEELDA